MKKMLKKVINIILSLGLFFQNFAFITPVFADEDNPEIIIKSITQNGKNLTKDGDVYVANDLGGIRVNVDLSTYAEPYTYLFKIINTNNNYSFSSGNSSNVYLDPYVDYTYEINEYVINLCLYDDYNCNEPITTLPFKVKFTRYKEVADSKLYIDNIMQGGKKVEPNDYGYISFNDAEDIVISLKGEKLIADGKYSLYSSFDNLEYTGSELNNGVTLNYNLDGKTYFYLDYEVYGMRKDFQYKKNDTFENVYFSVYTDENIANYQADLLYTNYKDITLDNLNFDSYDNRVIVRKKYHNKNNTLTYRITGNNYEDKDYSVKVLVSGDNTELYNKTFKVNGKLLNNGYDLELTGLNLGDAIYGKYTFNITINEITKKQDVFYDSYDFTVTSLTQNDVELEKIDGVYQVPGLSNLYARFSVGDKKIKNNIYLVVASEDGRMGSDFDINEEESLSIDLNQKETTYKFYLCDNFNCDGYYGETEIKTNLVNYDAIKAGKINLLSVKQGGKEIKLEDSIFHLNRVQDTEFSFKGENLVDDIDYTIRLGYSTDQIVKGSELNKGVTLTFKTKDSDAYNNLDYFDVELSIDDMHIDNYCYIDGDNSYCTEDNYIRYQFDKKEEVPDYEGKLKYTNYKDIDIELVDLYMNSLYALNTKYHDSKNSLTYRIEGNNFEDKNYTIALEVKRDDKEYFKKEYTVNGLLLNNGYDLELKGLTLEKKTSTDIDENMYNISINIAGITNSASYYFNSVGKPVYVVGDLYFSEDGDNANGATYGTVTGEPIHKINKHIFDNNNKVGIQFKGYEFDKNDTYSYVIEYGYLEKESGKYKSKYVSNLKSGTISGNDLAQNGLKIEVNNSKNYEMPAYRIVVKKGDEILANGGLAINLVDTPSILETTLSVDNKIIKNDNSYTINVQKGKDIKITLNGLSFENKDYSFNVCSNGYSAGDYNSTQQCDDVILNGNDLNNGKATITLSHDTEIHNQYGVRITNSDINLPTPITFSIYYYDEGSYIINPGDFKVEDDYIRDLYREVPASDILNMMTFADGYTAKIFDKTGTKEIDSIVGTGMILKIFDSNNQVVDEKVLAVKADLTGDGKTTISDVVKAKKHVASVEELTGVYKEAGDLSNSGDITLTDLIKMARDVAGLRDGYYGW